jgi:hypothetical protein
MDWLDHYLDGLSDGTNVVYPPDSNTWRPVKPTKQQTAIIQDSIIADMVRARMIEEARRELENHSDYYESHIYSKKPSEEPPPPPPPSMYDPTNPIIYYDATNPASYSGSGNTIYDLTGNSLSGTFVGNPTFNNVSGDKYFTWNASSYLYTPILDESSTIKKALTGNRPQHSVEIWVYPTNASGIYLTHNGTNVENNGYENAIMEVVAGTPYYSIWTTTALKSSLVTTTSVSINSWHQLVFVYNGTRVIGYVDGVEASRTNTDTDFRTPNEITAGGLRIMFGSYAGTRKGATTRFAGRWRKMRVYDYALSDAQVLSNYNAG